MGIRDAFQVQGFFNLLLRLGQSKRENPSHFESHPTSKFYLRWVVDIFSKSCFVLITFMYVISKHGYFQQFPLEIWQNLPKKSQKDLCFICMLPQCKNSPKTNHWPWPSQTLKYPTPLWVPPKTSTWDRV
jgi:hypothetical protein